MFKNRLAVNIFFGVNGFLFANYISRLPAIQRVYGLDNGGIGMLLLFAAIGALFAMPFTGWLIVGNGSRRISALAGLLFCLLVPLIGLMPNVWMLGGLFFVKGLATGTMDVAMNAQAVLVEQAHRRPVMSSFHAIFSAGMMIGAGCGALFTNFQAGLVAHLGVVALISLLLIAWAIRHLLRDGRHAEAGGQSRFRLPDASLVGIGLIAFCCMLGEGAMADWSTNYMLRIAGAKPGFAPIGLAAFSGAMMTARFFGDYVRGRLGDRLLMIYNSILATAGLGLLLLFPYPAVVLIGLFLVGLGLSVIVPIAYSTAGRAPGLSPGVGIGMVTTIGYSGFLFGPPIIGFLADWQNLRVALAFILLLFIMMTVLSVRFRPPGSVQQLV
jgi:predicted MFS family arabinose efflux permease